MSQLLSAEDLVAIKSALFDVQDTFFKKSLTIHHRTVSQKRFGEGVQETYVPFTVHGLSEFTRADAGKYSTVDVSPTGMEQNDGWRFYLWKDEVDALLTVNPEADKVELDGKRYDISFWAPSALFSDLGELLYELEIKYNRVPVV